MIRPQTVDRAFKHGTRMTLLLLSFLCLIYLRWSGYSLLYCLVPFLFCIYILEQCYLHRSLQYLFNLYFNYRKYHTKRTITVQPVESRISTNQGLLANKPSNQAANQSKTSLQPLDFAFQIAKYALNKKNKNPTEQFDKTVHSLKEHSAAPEQTKDDGASKLRLERQNLKDPMGIFNADVPSHQKSLGNLFHFEFPIHQKKLAIQNNSMEEEEGQNNSSEGEQERLIPFGMGDNQSEENSDFETQDEVQTPLETSEREIKFREDTKAVSRLNFLKLTAMEYANLKAKIANSSLEFLEDHLELQMRNIGDIKSVLEQLEPSASVRENEYEFSHEPSKYQISVQNAIDYLNQVISSKSKIEREVIQRILEQRRQLDEFIFIKGSRMDGRLGILIKLKRAIQSLRFEQSFDNRRDNSGALILVVLVLVQRTNIAVTNPEHRLYLDVVPNEDTKCKQFAYIQLTPKKDYRDADNEPVEQQFDLIVKDSKGLLKRFEGETGPSNLWSILSAYKCVISKNR